MSFNFTQNNPFMYNNMYGGNFVDMIFRHLMEHGWEGFTIMTILNFYLYLSLDRIKDLFKYVNDVLADMGKKNLEWGKNYTYNKATDILKLFFDKIKFIKISIPWRKIQILDNKVREANKVTVSFNCENKMDLMAIGNFLLRNRKKLGIVDYCRTICDVYKTTESFLVPNTVTVDYNILKSYGVGVDFEGLVEDITIKIIQNVELTLFCETDHKIEILKNVTAKLMGLNNIIETIYTEFNNIIETLIAAPKSEFPKFTSIVINHESDPCNFMGAKATGLIFFIYYTKNFALLKKFYNFVKGLDTFDFGGRKYKMVSLEDRILKIKDDDMMEKFIVELETYCNKIFIPYYQDSSSKIEKWINNSKHLFNEVTTAVVPAIKMVLESEKMPNTELSTYSRYLITSLVNNYYKQNVESIGNKISVYQLQITYQIETKKRENPEYTKWAKYNKDDNSDEEDNTNETEEEENEDNQKEKKNTKSTIKTKKNGKKETSTESTKKEDSDKKSPDRMPKYGYYSRPMSPGEYFGPNFAGPFNKYDNIPMMKPDKFIEEEIQIPIAESIHIKTDKKPFQYLYLQEMQKKTLESYMTNFKNNREMYDKMGIPYKGGILLSGVPGCGKTSTILAIGTYLNKDIYYLDLGKIKTNQELKICIDYVKTNSQKGGIIIFEDIDCMTDIVKCRVKKAEKNKLMLSDEPIQKNISKIKNLVNNNSLSLSFLLNILDGTLSPENIIFVITTNHVEELDEALIRPGRMDISINVDKCDKYQLRQIFFDLYNRELSSDVLNRFIEYKYITAQIIMHLFHNIYNSNIPDEVLLEKFLVADC